MNLCSFGRGPFSKISCVALAFVNYRYTSLVTFQHTSSSTVPLAVLQTFQIALRNNVTLISGSVLVQ